MLKNKIDLLIISSFLPYKKDVKLFRIQVNIFIKKYEFGAILEELNV